MNEMTLKQFKEYVKKNDTNITRINKNTLSNNFVVCCRKCGSSNVIIKTSFDYSMGSEYTGVYGEEVKLLFKCKDCGNGEEFIE